MALDKLLTPKEAATAANVSTKTILRWIDKKRFSYIPLGPRIFRIPEDAFRFFLDKKKVVVS